VVELLSMKKRAIVGLAALALAALSSAPGSATASGSRACGQVGGFPIHAHGLSCRTALHIYRADMAGNLPSGWTCSASLARCYKGEFGSSHYMWWRRTTYRLAGSVVLGGVVYGAPTGEGWGSAHPDTIFNGGDLSGLISNVYWSSWGGPVAHGRGRHSLFKPRGGYYRHPVVAQLKAVRIGDCEGRSAYLKLLIREPRRPGGALRPWHSWSGPQTICEPYGSYLSFSPRAPAAPTGPR
jgi:hypothetical protein